MGYAETPGCGAGEDVGGRPDAVAAAEGARGGGTGAVAAGDVGAGSDGAATDAGGAAACLRRCSSSAIQPSTSARSSAVMFFLRARYSRKLERAGSLRRK